jgi:hypothetical protein
MALTFTERRSKDTASNTNVIIADLARKARHEGEAAMHTLPFETHYLAPIDYVVATLFCGSFPPLLRR